MYAIIFYADCENGETVESFCTFTSKEEFVRILESAKKMSDLTEKDWRNFWNTCDHELDDDWDEISGWVKYSDESDIIRLAIDVFDVTRLNINSLLKA